MAWVLLIHSHEVPPIRKPTQTILPTLDDRVAGAGATP